MVGISHSILFIIYTLVSGLGYLFWGYLPSLLYENFSHTLVLSSIFPGRFGVLNIQNETVVDFNEKVPGDGGWINGGYFVLEPEVLDYIENDKTIWEREPLEKLAKEGNLSAYRHKEFWHPMDTLWDKNHLENLWNENNAPWKVW